MKLPTDPPIRFPCATVVRQEPRIRVPHAGDGHTMLDLEQAKTLHDSLGASIREIEHSSLRLKVQWTEGALRRSLSVLLGFREGHIVSLSPDTEPIAVAIACICAVLGDEA